MDISGNMLSDQPHNPRVAGSSPAGPTNIYQGLYGQRTLLGGSVQGGMWLFYSFFVPFGRSHCEELDCFTFSIHMTDIEIEGYFNLNALLLSAAKPYAPTDSEVQYGCIDDLYRKNV
jgi:hypothetical protein